MDEEYEFLDELGDLSAADRELLAQLIPTHSYSRGTILLHEGEVAREAYYVLEGCVRAYYLVNGEEYTTAFYTENESCAALYSYTNQVPASFFLECIEDCTLTVLSFENEQRIIRDYPRFESLCRVSMESDFGKNQEMLAFYLSKSPEERYLHLLETRPELFRRIPQYQLASYLGVKPESLSRIRKRIAGKEQKPPATS